MNLLKFFILYFLENSPSYFHQKVQEVARNGVKWRGLYWLGAKLVYFITLNGGKEVLTIK